MIGSQLILATATTVPEGFACPAWHPESSDGAAGPVVPQVFPYACKTPTLLGPRFWKGSPYWRNPGSHEDGFQAPPETKQLITTTGQTRPRWKFTSVPDGWTVDFFPYPTMGVAEGDTATAAACHKACQQAFSQYGPQSLVAPLHSSPQNPQKTPKSDNDMSSGKQKRARPETFTGYDDDDDNYVSFMDRHSPRKRRAAASAFIVCKQEQATGEAAKQDAGFDMATYKELRDPKAVKTRVYGSDMNAIAATSLAKGAGFVRLAANLGDAPVPTAPRWSTAVLKEARDKKMAELKDKNLGPKDFHQQVLAAV